MKKLLGAIRRFFRCISALPDNVAVNVSPHKPEPPTLTNSGPLIENEDEDTRFMERNLSSKETWEENQRRARALYLIIQERRQKAFERHRTS